VYDASSAIGPKLSSIIRGDWYWPSARSEALVEIQSRLPETKLEEIDQVVWTQKEAPSLVLRHEKGLSDFLLPSLNTLLCFGLLSLGL
jgi:hypothetical protein